MRFKLEKYGSFGAIVAAAACPICFPKLALIGAFLGLGALAKYETFFFYGAHVLILIALVGHVISYKKVQNRTLLALAIISASLFFVSLYLIVSEMLAYTALTGLVAATIWMIVESRHCDGCVASSV
jgi:mercuric ion transport protein